MNASRVSGSEEGGLLYADEGPSKAILKSAVP